MTGTCSLLFALPDAAEAMPEHAVAAAAAEDSTLVLPENYTADVDGNGILTIMDVRAVLQALKPFSITVGKAAGKPGETVKIPVRIYGDKGTAGGQIYISYDSRLRPVSVTAGDAYSMYFEADCTGYPLYLAWTSQSGENQTASNGAVLAYLEFEIDPNIPQTEYLEVSVLSQAGFNRTQFTDTDGYTVTASCGTGYITALP